MLAKGGVQGVGLLVVAPAHFKGSQHVWGLLQVSKCWERQFIVQALQKQATRYSLSTFVETPS